MHDFCFTLPYGGLLIIGGLIGLLLKGSWMSFMGGSGSGAILLLVGSRQLSEFKKGANSWLAIVVQEVIAVSLTVVLGKRYTVTQKIMPAGIVAGLSMIMSLFYFYKIVTGGNHFKKKGTE